MSSNNKTYNGQADLLTSEKNEKQLLRQTLSRRWFISALGLTGFSIAFSALCLPSIKWRPVFLGQQDRSDKKVLQARNRVAYLLTIWPFADQQWIEGHYEELAVGYETQWQNIETHVINSDISKKSAFFSMTPEERVKIISHAEKLGDQFNLLLISARQDLLRHLLRITPSVNILGYYPDKSFYAGINWKTYDKKPCL